MSSGVTWATTSASPPTGSHLLSASGSTLRYTVSALRFPSTHAFSVVLYPWYTLFYYYIQFTLVFVGILFIFVPEKAPFI